MRRPWSIASDEGIDVSVIERGVSDDVKSISSQLQELTGSARGDVVRGKALSIVIPCYNEEEVLPETIKRLRCLIDDLTNTGLIDPDSELILVDDGSRDQTWNVIRAFNKEDKRVKGLKLSDNRGHQTALIAGLFASHGDAVVSLDADLQDDLNAIKEMMNAYLAGAEIVYGVRASRETDTYFKRKTALWYYSLMEHFGVRIVHNHADYRLLSRRALDSLRQYSEINLFLRGIIPLLGYRSAKVYYRRAERFAGKSKYPLRKMLAFAADGITSFTAVPLRLIAFTGIGVSFLSAALGVWVLWVKVFNVMAVPGWASTVLPMYFIGGIQLLSIGVLGEYVAKLYFEAKRRPRYFIEEML
jgi:polyisoprenyl-phosphate glycosyltransferase